MVEEAVSHGLSIDRRTLNHLAWGKPRVGSPFSYVEPDFAKDLHNSMSGPWPALAWPPKRDRFEESMKRTSFWGHYIPNAEPRAIPDGAFVHESVILRTRAVSSYQPINLPQDHTVVPLTPPPH